MASEKTIKYGRPTPPTDPNAEYMSVQETAFIFGCGVNTVRKLARQAGMGGLGRRIMLSKANRDLLWAKHSGRRRLKNASGPPKRAAGAASKPVTQTAEATESAAA